MLAKERHNSFGKTEMWYIIDADKDAELILGFNQTMDKDKYKKYLEQNALPKSYNIRPLKRRSLFG